MLEIECHSHTDNLHIPPYPDKSVNLSLQTLFISSYALSNETDAVRLSSSLFTIRKCLRFPLRLLCLGMDVCRLAVQLSLFLLSTLHSLAFLHSFSFPSCLSFCFSPCLSLFLFLFHLQNEKSLNSFSASHCSISCAGSESRLACRPTLSSISNDFTSLLMRVV